MSIDERIELKKNRAKQEQMFLPQKWKNERDIKEDINIEVEEKYGGYGICKKTKK